MQRQRSALANKLRECRKPAQHLSHEPNELATKEIAAIPTISGSPLENIYQFYYVQRENLENKINKLQFFEEMKESGVSQFNQTQSLLDHEMANMSPVEKMSYFHSQMHFDESMESIADSEIEDEDL